MLNVGLTGNVASGKTTVANLFREWGATVIDADTLVREAQQPGTPTLAAIRERFGDGILRPDGTLDRSALRQLVLGDPAARRDLEALVHPYVRRRRDELARAAETAGARVLVNDIPLLFETLDPAAFDVVVLVDADPDVRRARLVHGRGLDPAEADRLLASQLPAAAKRGRSDFVLDNSGSPAELRARAREVWQALLARA
jgi:dephospho-CoA kinase